MSEIEPLLTSLWAMGGNNLVMCVWEAKHAHRKDEGECHDDTGAAANQPQRHGTNENRCRAFASGGRESRAVECQQPEFIRD